MLIDIIPSEHSIGIHPLTYSIPEGFEGVLIPGCIVEIPVRSGTEYGIVVGFRKYAPEGMELKNIICIVTDKEILASYQIALILEISRKYLIPIHRVLGFFLSKAVIKRLEKKRFEQILQKYSSSRTLQNTNNLTILKESVITGDILRNYTEE
jgi:primosomal protein N'